MIPCCAPSCAALNARLCQRCLSAAYCSVACQRADLAAHKPVCKRVAAAAVAAALDARVAAGGAEAALALCERSASRSARGEHDDAVADARDAVAGARQLLPAHLRLCQALFARLVAAAAGGPTPPTHESDTRLSDWMSAALPADVFATQQAGEVCMHTAKALLMARTRGVTFEAAFGGAIGGIAEGGFSASEEEVLLVQAAVSKNLHDFLVFGAGRLAPSLYMPMLQGQMGAQSLFPQWVCRKVRALCDALEFKASRIHGTGIFAARAFEAGELLFDLDYDEEAQRAASGAELGLEYDLSDSQFKVLGAAIFVTSLLGTVNDAKQPDYMELGAGEAAAARELACYASASARAVNIAITHPQSAQGGLMWRHPGTGSLGFLCLRVAAVRAIAAGEELTRSYGALAWAVEALQQATGVRRMGFPAPVERLRALALALAQKAPEVIAAELGVRSISDIGDAEVVRQYTAWSVEMATLTVTTHP